MPVNLPKRPVGLPYTPKENKYVESRVVPLARLGVDSGGTMTERTNGSDLALDLALRRSAGTYTLAFKDDGPRDGRPRSVEVWLRPTGLHAVHAAVYASRSDAMKRESLLQAAYVSPALFDTGVVHASLVPLSPRSRSTWRAQLVVSFSVQPRAAGETGPAAKLEAVVSRGPDVFQEVVRDVVPASEPVVSTVIETVDLKPGKYTVAAVLSDPGAALPRATSIEVEVPEIGSAPFLLGPMLGQRIDAVSPAVKFAPLPGDAIDPRSELAILTSVCAPLGKRAAAPSARRILRTSSGDTVLEFHDAGDPIDRCTPHVDVVPAGTLVLGTDYVFEAGLLGDDAAVKSVRFSAGTPRNVAASR